MLNVRATGVVAQVAYFIARRNAAVMKNVNEPMHVLWNPLPISLYSKQLVKVFGVFRAVVLSFRLPLCFTHEAGRLNI